jgi:hypothetical protein
MRMDFSVGKRAAQAWIVAGLLFLFPLALVTVETVQRRRLTRRLNTIRAQAQEVRKL